MDQNTNNVTLADVLRLFKGKFKALLCTALVVGILVAAIGVGFTFVTAEYSGSVVLHLAPADASRFILNLVSSDRFAETLLLDEYGLPPKEYCDEDEYNEALEAAKQYYVARETMIDLERQDELFAYSFALIEQKYNGLNEEYTRLFNMLSIYKNAQTDEVAKDPSHFETTKKYEELVARADEQRTKYKQEVRDVEVQKRLALDKQVAEAKVALDDAREDYEELTEKIITKWRNDPEIDSLARRISGAITCEYEKNLTKEELENIKDDSLIRDYNNLSLLRITVKTDISEEFAADVLDRIKEKAPAFIQMNAEKNLEIAKSRCTVLTTFAHPTNHAKNNLLINIVLFGAIGAVGSLLIHSVCIVTVGLLPPDLQPKKKVKKSKADKKENESAA